jgi:formylglycine-generating enzyme required for sulfatase activity
LFLRIVVKSKKLIQGAFMKKLLASAAILIFLPVLSSAYADEIKDQATGMEFVLVKGGCFKMGDISGDGQADEKPVHEVCVDDFYIGKYPVTQGQWKAIMEKNPSYFKECGDTCPADGVTWKDVVEFIGKFNHKTKKGQRLPTEAEWEYAARSGGGDEKWAGTNNEAELADYAWYSRNSGFKPHPVGQKRPNGSGIYDMTGNVWQWVEDYYGEKYYGGSPRNNPQGPGRGQFRVLRGGSWYFNAKDVRLSARFHGDPAFRSNDFGFRLVRPK